jgi:tetratricopeptide (TPR) repeat protein
VAAVIVLATTCAWVSRAQAQPPAEPEPPATPAGVLDPRAPLKPFDQALEEVRRNQLAEPAMRRYEAGDYWQAARLGLAALSEAPNLHGLRLAVANSLAWTGRYPSALAEYRTLLGTPQASEARVGMANVLLWSGRADLAEPIYLSVLDGRPGDEDAKRGLALAGRELRPSLSLRLVQSKDDQNFARDETWLTYRRWSADRAWRYEASVLRDQNRSPTGDATEYGLQASAWATHLPLSPRVEAAIYDSRLFGNIQIEPARGLLLRAGRVNWGRSAFTAAALRDGLTANSAGLTGDADLGLGLGSVRARIDGYEISDGNRLFDGELQITPGWQPLPWGLQWFGGVYGRRAEHEDPRYWSPHPAYGLAFAGLRRGWYTERSDLTATVRAGAGFTDTAKNSWTAALTGRYWLSADIAVGLEAWVADAPRPAPYRMHQVAAFLQHLW